ncbi:hypothetical protein BC830DRAFT_1070648 [Chytriomyces sp. MP71]|nr:hypothetical protein BC830DRAFT_1070648 [Chytriomyces sp. MP71]
MLDSIDVLLYPLLRWIICSHRGFIRELKEVEERVHGVHGGYVQFQLVLGSPEKEARLQLCRKEHAADKSMRQIEVVPTLFAWHGSPLHNWHSIIRNGLNFHKVTHGRAYGNGIYHARDLQTSEGYGGVTTSIWGNSTLKVTRCISLNEIVNAPEQFQSSSPYLVVQYEDWVQARYLLVGKLGQVAATPYSKTAQQPTSQVTPIEVPPPFAKYKVLDTRIKPTGSNGQALFIPDSFASAARGEGKKLVIFDLCKGFTNLERLECEKRETAETRAAGVEGEFLADSPTATNVAKNSSVSMMKVEVGMMPSPSYATTAASNYLHRELIRIVRLQEKLSVEERGWVLDVDNISNLYQWRLRLVGLDESLPLAKDMKVVGIILEVRFGPDCPLTPPFIRIIEPRFMPFSQGGGGHVTLGGSICMDLLTMSGWSPIYTFESVLLQVRMALSNLDPHPARLDPSRWNQSYGAGEAMAAFVRVARDHGWEVPKGWSAYFD